MAALRMLLVIAALLVPELSGASTNIVRPVQVLVSPDGEWIVRIEARIDFGATSAVAHWYQVDGLDDYRRITSAPLKNRTSPELAYLTNTGALITIGDTDDERELMLAIYSPDGKLVKSWPLIMMFRSDYLTCLLHKAMEAPNGDGVGSLYWLATAERFSGLADRVYIRDRLLGSLEIDTRSGEIKSLEVPCKLPLGEMTWELENSPKWKPARHLPSAFMGTSYLLKVFTASDHKWRLEQVEYATTERSTYEGLAGMLSPDARVIGRGEAAGLPVLYSELFEEFDGIRHVSAVSGDNTRALRLSISWRTGKVDETAAVIAELKSMMAGIRRVNTSPSNEPSSQPAAGERESASR